MSAAARLVPRLARTSIRQPMLAAPSRIHLVPTQQHLASSSSARQQLRQFSASPFARSAKPAIIKYEELKPITEAPNDDILIVDVREPDEVALGSIPSAVNLPLSAFEKNIGLDSGDFVKQLGFRKPAKEQEMIFYCRSGKRSATAIELAKKAGFKSVRNYEGSWLDWEAREQAKGSSSD